MRTRSSVFALAALLVLPASAAGQNELDGTRFGITFGSTGIVGFSVELFDDDRAVDVTVGTWSFRDISISVTGKQLLGAAAFKPSVGLGIWTVVGWDTSDNPDATRNGVTVLARAPVGFDWNLDGDSFLTAELGITRALWIRRMVPADDRPASTNLVPIPGLAFRVRS